MSAINQVKIVVYEDDGVFRYSKEAGYAIYSRMYNKQPVQVYVNNELEYELGPNKIVFIEDCELPQIETRSIHPWESDIRAYAQMLKGTIKLPHDEGCTYCYYAKTLKREYDLLKRKGDNMYGSRYDSESKDEVRFGKRILVWVIGLVFVVSGIVWLATRVEKTIDNAFINYEEFQSIYNTCQQLNTDIKTIRDIPDADKSFTQFSKAQQIAAKKQNLNRWVEEYNAKSRMWNRVMWKSNSLPYQLNTNDFPNYRN